MKFNSLITNELQKETKKNGFRMVFVIILVIVLMLPSTVNLFAEATFERDTQQLRENHTQRLFLAKSSVEDLDVNTPAEKLTYAIAMADIQYWQTLVDANMEYMDWREHLADQYQSQLYLLKAFELSLDGVADTDIDKTIFNVDLDKLYPFFNMTEKEKQLEISKQQKVIENTRKIILDNDYEAYLENEIAYNIATLDKMQKEFDNKTYKIREEKFLDDIGRVKVDLAVLQFRLDNKIPYDRSDWRSNALNTIIEETVEAFRTPMNREEFDVNAPVMSIMGSYDDYVTNMAARREKAENSVDINWYNLQQDIVPLGSLDDARSLAKQFYPVLIILTGLLGVVIASGSIANEFSKGTIRLLLIRPFSRTKIILAKLANVFIICFALFSIGSVLLIISCGINASFSDYAIHVTQIYQETVREVSFFGYMLPQIALSLISVVFICSLAFSLSVMTKNVAISVAGSMVIYFSVLPITMILLLNNATIIMNTFVPNINMALFDLMPSFESTLANIPGSMPINIFGGLQLIVISMVLVIASCAKFSKSDIVN